MPTTTDSGFVIPSSGSEPADMYGVATRLGNSAEAVINPTYTDVTYEGSWTDFGGGYEEVGYTKVGNEVKLRGTAKHATAGQTGTVFTLPDGYWPAATKLITVGANTGHARITISTAGVVAITAYIGTGTAASIEFDLVRFDTAS